MYQITQMINGLSEDTQSCETLEEAMKVLEGWMQGDFKVLASQTLREDEKVTFKIEKKEVIFSVTY